MVNYQCPEDEKTYLHRIGRTGRAGKTGHRGHLRRLGRHAALGPDQQGPRPRHPGAGRDVLDLPAPLRRPGHPRRHQPAPLPTGARTRAGLEAEGSRISARPVERGKPARAVAAAAVTTRFAAQRRRRHGGAGTRSWPQAHGARTATASARRVAGQSHGSPPATPHRPSTSSRPSRARRTERPDAAPSASDSSTGAAARHPATRRRLRRSPEAATHPTRACGPPPGPAALDGRRPRPLARPAAPGRGFGHEVLRGPARTPHASDHSVTLLLLAWVIAVGADRAGSVHRHRRRARRRQAVALEAAGTSLRSGLLDVGESDLRRSARRRRPHRHRSTPAGGAASSITDAGIDIPGWRRAGRR